MENNHKDTEDKASVTYDGVVWDVPYKGSIAFFRNEEGIKGPKLFKLNTGKHALSLGSPHVISGLGKTLGDCQFDAVYITGNLNLRHDQIQRRFEMTMGYREKPKAMGTKEKAVTAWARIKREHGEIRE